MPEPITAAALDWRTLLAAAEDTPPEIVAALDRYFSVFAQLNFVKDEDGEEILTLRNLILQYHPDHVRTEEPEAARA